MIDTDEGILLKPKQTFEPTKLEDAISRPAYRGKPKTIEQMNAAVDKEMRKRWQ